MTIIEELRGKESRDNRDLLDRAAAAIEELNIQLDVALGQYERNTREQARNYNMKVDKLHLAYRQLIKDARAEVLEDIKAHAQHPGGRVVYVITEEQLLAYVAEWKRFYRRLERLGTQEAQDAWLEEQMKECFPTCGFPQFRIDELKRAEDSELLEKGDMKDA